jgi:hypothetical protein
VRLAHRSGEVLIRRVLPVTLGLATCTAALIGLDPGVAAGPARLPDLDQAPPSKLSITRAEDGYRLGFRSAVSNVGDGPLAIVGHRAGVEVTTMTADQLIERQGVPQSVVEGVGTLRFVVSPNHRHWHLLRFERYELRRPGHPGPAAVRDRKTGFCLGDRYPVLSRSLPAAPAAPVYTTRCGLRRPQLTGIAEGISVGYGDDYPAHLEGQYLPLDGLEDGRYVLVHRVNADRRLRELDYRNNAASVLIQLRRRRSVPQIRILRRCPGSARCVAR